MDHFNLPEPDLNIQDYRIRNNVSIEPEITIADHLTIFQEMILKFNSDQLVNIQ